jgi:lipopolysaccharide export LptBFGC system permease protein LptF
MPQAYVGLALPMASLLASLLAFGRMGSDCEIIGAFLFLLCLFLSQTFL